MRRSWRSLLPIAVLIAVVAYLYVQRNPKPALPAPPPIGASGAPATHTRAASGLPAFLPAEARHTLGTNVFGGCERTCVGSCNDELDGAAGVGVSEYGVQENTQLILARRSSQVEQRQRRTGLAATRRWELIHVDQRGHPKGGTGALVRGFQRARDRNDAVRQESRQ